VVVNQKSITVSSLGKPAAFERIRANKPSIGLLFDRGAYIVFVKCFAELGRFNHIKDVNKVYPNETIYLPKFHPVGHSHYGGTGTQVAPERDQTPPLALSMAGPFLKQVATMPTMPATHKTMSEASTLAMKMEKKGS